MPFFLALLLARRPVPVRKGIVLVDPGHASRLRVVVNSPNTSDRAYGSAEYPTHRSYPKLTVLVNLKHLFFSMTFDARHFAFFVIFVF